jgi:hypothetical protein
MADDEYKRSLGFGDDIRDPNTGNIGFFERQDGFERDSTRENVISKLYDDDFSKYRNDLDDGSYVTVEFSEEGALSDVEEDYDWILDIIALSPNEGQPVPQDLTNQVDRYVEELAERFDVDVL